MIAAHAISTALPLAITAGALGWAAVSDIRHYIIPNRTAIAIVAAFGLYACAMPWSFLIGGVGTGLVVFAMATLFFARGWMGGGDAKLLTATGLWAGPSFLSAFTAVTCLSGAALALLMLSPARRLMPAPSVDAVNLTGSAGSGLRQPMPFGVAIAVGGLFVVALRLQHN
jgi:prepilin peptidase CpaA